MEFCWQVSQSGVPVWTRRARRGFVTEISVFACVAVGLSTLTLFGMGFSHIQPGVNRAPGYAVAAGYFVGSAGILMWAIRSAGHQRRRAYLIPALVMIATLIAIVLIERMF